MKENFQNEIIWKRTTARSGNVKANLIKEKER